MQECNLVILIVHFAQYLIVPLVCIRHNLQQVGMILDKGVHLVLLFAQGVPLANILRHKSAMAGFTSALEPHAAT